MEAKHTLDGQHYAIKVVTLKASVDSSAADKVLREVTCLAALDHPNCIRYNAAWFELGYTTTHFAHPPSSSPDSEFSYDEHDVHSSPSDGSWLSTDIGTDGGVRSGKGAHAAGGVLSSSPGGWNGTSPPPSQSTSVAGGTSSAVAPRDAVGRSEHRANGINGRRGDGPGDAHTSASTPRLRLYIQMQLCDFSLHDWLRDRAKRGGKVVPDVCVQLFKQVLSGIAHIHSKGLIHRDVKPRNIFLKMSPGGDVPHVKLGDFGLATTSYIDVDADTPTPFPPSPDKESDSTPSSTEPPTFAADADGDASSPSPLPPGAGAPALPMQVRREGSLYRTELTSGVGTGTYASPEQLSKSAYDQKADIYSLGTYTLRCENVFECVCTYVCVCVYACLYVCTPKREFQNV